MKFKPFLRLSAMTLTLLSGAGLAQDSTYHPALTDNFNLYVGVFRSENILKLGAGAGAVQGTEIDFNQAARVDKSNTIGNVELAWKFGKGRKWQVAGQYFSTKASGDAILEEDVEWQDVLFPEGSFVEAGVQLDIIRLFVGRSLIKNERQNLGIGLGIHDLDVSAYVGGEARVIVDSTGYIRRDANLTQPLPNLGAWYDYSPARRWLVHARADWIGASIDEYDGSLWNVNVGINFQPWRNVGLDLSYEFFRLNGNVDRKSWYGGLEMRYSGPVFSLTANW
jgi:hypothetical protein